MRIKIYLLLSCLCVCFFQSHSQSTKYFKKEIGNPNPFFEAGQSVNALNNGYVVGAHSVIGNPYDIDVYIVKTDSLGNTIWQTKILDSLSNNNIFTSVVGNENYFFAGEIGDFVNSRANGFMLKLDTMGTILWQKVMGDTSLSFSIYNMIISSDGNLVMAGWIEDTTTLFWQGHLFKADTSGNIIWERTYPGIYNSAITAVIELTNGNFALIGRTEFVLGSGKVWFLLVDSAGNLISTQSYFVGTPSTINDFQIANTIDISIDSGFIIGGHGGAGGGLYRGLIIKINSIGQVDWFKMLSANPDGSGNLWTSDVTRIKQLPDSSFILTGFLRTGGIQPFKMILIKFDFYGNELWRRSFNSVNGYDSYGYDLDLTNDGGFILTGRAEDSTDADVYLVKTNCLGFTNAPQANFSTIWNGNDATFYNLSLRADTCIYYFGDGDSVIVHLTDTIPVVHIYAGSGPYQPYLLAFACGETDTLYQTIYSGLDDSKSLIEKSFSIFPNPANDKLTISIILPTSIKNVNLLFSDLTGRPIATRKLNENIKEQEIDISFLNAGSYMVSVENNGAVLSTRKMMVIK